MGSVLDFSTANIRLFITFDVAYDRFAYVVHKLGERPVFLLTGFQFAFQFCVVGLPWFPERGLGLGGRHFNFASMALLRLSPVLMFHFRTSCIDKRWYLCRNKAPAALP
jgi:hypothetical protein